MEIDFLGLNLLSKYEDEHQKNYKESFLDSAVDKEEVETSLSLGSSSSSSPSIYPQRDILNLQEKKITCELFPCSKKIASCPCNGSSISNNKPFCCPYNNNVNIPKTEQPNDQLVLVSSNPVFVPRSTTDGRFMYTPKHTSIGLRPPHIGLYSSQANDAVNYNLPQKANNNSTVYTPRDQCGDRRKGNRVPGHIPTVAMARKATLTRFLKKRLHRMNQERSTYLVIEGSLQMHNNNYSKAASTSFNSCMNNKDNIS